MAGRAKHRNLAVATDPVSNQRTRKRTARNRSAYGDLMLVAAEQGMSRRAGQSNADILQEVLDRAVSGMRYAASETDKLTPDEFWVRKYDAQGNVLVEPNKWYQLERECREEVERLAAVMAQLGIEERHVQVEEARAVLIVSAIRDAAREAGIPPAKIRALGAGLRERLEGEVAA